MTQEGAFLASLGMQCQTGSCVYNSSHPAPPGPPAPPSPPPLPPHEHHDVAAEVITLIGIGMVVSLGMVLGGFLIYQDNRLSQERYKAWSEGGCVIDNHLNAKTCTEGPKFQQGPKCECATIGCHVHTNDSLTFQLHTDNPVASQLHAGTLR